MMLYFVIPSVGVTPILSPFLRNGRSTIGVALLAMKPLYPILGRQHRLVHQWSNQIGKQECNYWAHADAVQHRFSVKVAFPHIFSITILLM